MKALLLLLCVMPLWLLLLLVVAGPPPVIMILDERGREAAPVEEERCPAGLPGVAGPPGDDAFEEMRAL